MNASPIILGLAGLAGVGKTSVAKSLAPMTQSRLIAADPDEVDPTSIYWTKLALASPIYQMVTARQKIQGDGSFSRQSYQIHTILTELLGARIEYEELVELVYEIMSLPCDLDGKPRSFMQSVGAMLREIDSDVYVKRLRHSIEFEHRLYLSDLDDEEDLSVPRNFGVVIDDVRYENEIQWIIDQANGFVVRLDASDGVRKDRLENRDGFVISSDQAGHESEQVNTFNEELFYAIVDTDNKDIHQVTQEVLDATIKTKSSLGV